MVKQSSLGISNRTTVTERCRIDESVQPAELIDCRRNNLFGRVSLVEISRYEGGLRSQLQKLGDRSSASPSVTTGKNDCRRARARGCSLLPISALLAHHVRIYARRSRLEIANGGMPPTDETMHLFRMP